MRALLSVFVVAASMALAGCVTVSPGTSQAGDVVSKVQEQTMRVCAFVPAAQTVVAITGYNTNANFATISDIVTQICAALQSRTPVVRGVRLQGQRL